MSTSVELSKVEKRRLYNLEYQRKRRVENPERVNELTTAWRKKNTEYFVGLKDAGYYRARSKVYRKEHPEKAREADRRFRHFKMEAARLRGIDI